MVKLNANEIQPGVVVWLDQDMLMADSDVEETLPQHHGTVRPFVCLAVDGARCIWTPLTGTHRDERLPIEHGWRSGGAPGWQTVECYLNDGANTYAGPLASFVQASHEERTRPGGRARVSEDGLQTILNEVQRQHHRRKAG